MFFNSKCNEVVEIIAKECQDVGMDYLEIGIDVLMDSDVLSKIPVVKSVYALINTPVTLRNAYSIKKLIYFCYCMKDIPSQERIKFVNKALYEDKNFGEKLLLCIEKIDDLEKVEMLKRLFQAYGHRDGIDYSTFRRLCLILEKAFLDDLLYIKNAKDKDYIGGVSALALTGYGLAQMCVFNANGVLDTDEIYSLNSIAIEFYECVFTDKYKVTV